MVGFSTGMAHNAGEREGAVWYGGISAALDQELEEVVVRDFLALNSLPGHKCSSCQVDCCHTFRIGP